MQTSRYIVEPGIAAGYWVVDVDARQRIADALACERIPAPMPRGSVRWFGTRASADDAADTSNKLNRLSMSLPVS